MSGEKISLPVVKSGTSDYMFHAKYSTPVQNSFEQDIAEYPEHQFSSQEVFPFLNQYVKADLVEEYELPSLSFEKKGSASLKMVETSSGFKNVLGHYQVDNEGTIHHVQIAFNNTRTKKAELTHQFNIDAGNDVHLFVVANGFALNREFSESLIDEGEFSFLYKFGENEERLAKVTDVADDITLVYKSEEGDITEIRGPVYHTTNDNAQEDINSDGHKHTVSGRIEENVDDVLRIGFEDFPGLGDADYNDIIVDLRVTYSQFSDEGYGNDIAQALHDQMIELKDQPDDVPLYDTGEEDGFYFGNVNDINVDFDVALNEEGEERTPIDVEDVLILDQEYNDDVVALHLGFSDHEDASDFTEAQVEDINPNAEIIGWEVSTNDTPDLEALFDIV